MQPQKELTEQAHKRLKAIKEFTSLGSGYKVAMRDLTIRGAGDMLGPQQAGFIDDVGLDLYLEMLASAIKEKQGKPIEKRETYLYKQWYDCLMRPHRFLYNSFQIRVESHIAFVLDLYRLGQRLGKC